MGQRMNRRLGAALALGTAFAGCRTEDQKIPAMTSAASMSMRADRSRRPRENAMSLGKDLP
jgi:hypothetical protein